MSEKTNDFTIGFVSGQLDIIEKNLVAYDKKYNDKVEDLYRKFGKINDGMIYLKVKIGIYSGIAGAIAGFVAAAACMAFFMRYS